MKLSTLLVLFAAAASFAATPMMNQLGFAPPAEKLVILPGNEATPIEIKDLKGRTVLTVKPSNATVWAASGEQVQVVDFSAITTPGTYKLYRSGKMLGTPFLISRGAYADVAKASLKWFYYQRSSTMLEGKYAGLWAREAGHPDTLVQVYGEQKTINAPKGWYDAGDYGKYVVNSAISVSTLLQLYETFPTFFDKLALDIPKSKKGLPDLLEEIRWNLDWMLAMQDTADGGVYHKLTTLKFSGSVMPAGDTAQRYVMGKNAIASLDFAGTLAQASNVYRRLDRSYAEKLLAAAEKAYAYAKAHPTQVFVQPKDVETGEYVPKNEDGKDEFRFAAAELYFATKKEAYLADLKANPFTKNGLWWGDVNYLAIYRVVAAPKVFGDDLFKKAKKILMDEADALKAEADTSGYRLAMHEANWTWGSNGAVAGNGGVLLSAYYLTGDKAYLKAAQRSLDYLLGKNPNRICYVTGFGRKSPRNPHHRPSEADEVDAPVPGMLVGGPHLGKQDVGQGELCKDYTTSGKPALAYLDEQCSYATNEVAINWNSSFAFLAASLHAIYNGEKPKLKPAK